MPRPGSLTAVCILTLCLAVIGTGTLLMGVFSLALQPRMNAALQNFSGIGMPAQQIKQQQELQSAIYEMQRPWMPVQWGLLGLHAVVVVLLYIGGIKGLRLSRRGDRWLLAAMAAAILLELLRIVPTIAIQRQMSGLMAAQFRQPGMPAIPPGFAEAIMTMSLVFAVVLVAAKIGFYAWGAYVATRDNVRRLFAEETET